jgi:hypothetical protein
LFLCVQAQASQTGVTGKDGDLFARISEAVSKVKTISGDFIQERRTNLLKEALISKGRFYFEPPNRLLWEITQPSISGFAMDGNKAKRWKGDRKFAQEFDIIQDPSIRIFAEHVFTWMRADFAVLEKMNKICVIEETPATIKLFPKQEGTNGPLDHFLVVFSHDLTHVVTVEIHETNGDFTKISFSNALINGPVLKKLF